MPVATNQVSPLEAYRTLPPSRVEVRRLTALKSDIRRTKAAIAAIDPGSIYGVDLERSLRHYEAQLDSLTTALDRRAQIAAADQPTFLRMTRSLAGLNQTQLGTMACVAVSAIRRLERGDSNPHYKHRDTKIAETLVATCRYHCTYPPADPNQPVLRIPPDLLRAFRCHPDDLLVEEMALPRA